MATTLGIKPDSRKVFQYRLYSLITDGGALVYRKVFTKHATMMSGSVSKHIENYKPAIQQSFLQRRINKEQFDILFPDRNPVATVDTCDVTLLAFLVRVTFVEETVDEILRNEITDLDKLRLFRNEIAHIHGTEGYDESTFEQTWQRIKVVIMNLGQGIPGLEGEIDALKVQPIDPKREEELQNLITDLKEKAAVAKDLERSISAKIEDKMNTVMEDIVTKMTTDGDKRDQKDQAFKKDCVTKFNEVQDQIYKGGNVLLENQKMCMDGQKALMTMLQKIYIDPSRQLPYCGDFGPDSGVPISLKAFPESSSFDCENIEEYKQPEGPLGIACVTKYRQVLTKVTAFDKSDYEDLSKAIGFGWPTVADHLRLSKSQIDSILAKFEQNENQAYIEEMVLIWGEREKEHATIERFINSVVNCPMMNVEWSAFEGIIGRHCITPKK